MGCTINGWATFHSYMSEAALVDEGYLLEANRQFFHPLGLQLVASVQEDGLRLRVVDRRFVLAGLVYEREEEEACSEVRRRKVARMRSAWEMRAQVRLHRYGFIVQPVERLW